MNTSPFKNFIKILLLSSQREGSSVYRDWRLVFLGSTFTLLTMVGLTLYMFMGMTNTPVATTQSSVLNEERLSAALEMIKQKDEAFQSLKSDGFLVVDPSL